MIQYINEVAIRLSERICAFDKEDRIIALFAGMTGKTITYEGLKASQF